MIPVTQENYIVFDLNDKPTNKQEKFRIDLLRNQLRWLTTHKKDIYQNILLFSQIQAMQKIQAILDDFKCQLDGLFKGESKC